MAGEAVSVKDFEEGEEGRCLMMGLLRRCQGEVEVVVFLGARRGCWGWCCCCCWSGFGGGGEEDFWAEEVKGWRRRVVRRRRRGVRRDSIVGFCCFFLSLFLSLSPSLPLSAQEAMSVKSGEMFKIDKGGEMNMDDGHGQDGKPASYLPRAF